jgi:hypothetical protein
VIRIFLGSLAAFAALCLPGCVLACSYPIRAHPVVMPAPSESVPDGAVQLQIAIDKLLVSKSELDAGAGWFRRWYGVRGLMVTSSNGLEVGQLIEIAGPLNGSCFFPGESYRFDGQERLIVWIVGRLKAFEGRLILLPTGAEITSITRPKLRSEWVRVLWGSPE